MFDINHLLIGIVCIVLGVLAIKYTFGLVGLTGRQDWIENVLGSGSTYLAFKIIAVLLVIFGLLYGLGLGTMVGEFVFAPLIGLFKPSN